MKRKKSFFIWDTASFFIKESLFGGKNTLFSANGHYF